MIIPKGYRVCIRCQGRKKLYKCGNGGWSFINSGGVLTSCPLCNESGTIPLLENAVEESKKVLEKMNLKSEKGSSNAKKESRRTAEA